METLFLDTETVAASVDLEVLVPEIEAAFRAYEQGRTQMPPKSYIELPQHNGDFRSMPAYVEAESWEGAAIKWVNVHPDNPERFELPTVMGTVIYSDPETAVPLAVIDGTELTRLRTGAAAAVATDRLAVPGASSLGIIGAGVQAYTQLRAIATVRPIDEVVIVDRNADRITAFIETFEDEFTVREGTIAEAGHCDVLSTVTPVREPIVTPGDVGPDTHINAMGADATGKQELATEILQNATVVIDDYEQCTHSGEINVPWSNGALTDANIAAELGAVVTGATTVEQDGISVFDSTGLAIQDVAAAHVAYEGAVEAGRGMKLSLLEPTAV